MTQLGEPVAIGIVLGADDACPFDHDSPTPPSTQNDFVGDATVLASNMSGRISTALYDPMKPGGLEAIVSPNDNPKHPFWDGLAEDQWPIQIPWRDEKSGKSGTHRYPVTCAAHHLIPAQESLKRATELHAFMIKKGDTEAVAEGKSKTTLSGGVVYADVGYDVNGSENGLFLPGNYAVTGLTMDDPYWTPELSVLAGIDWEHGEAPDNENVAKPKQVNSPKLTGHRHQINNENRKWLYVKQAVKMAPGQFHDRHADYSNWVVDRLNTVGIQYRKQAREIMQNVGCDKCKERFKKFKDAGLPTPFKLLSRLNASSTGLKGLLGGSVWRSKVVTSNWGQAYILAKTSNTPDAD
ncbi:hypothetical protein VVD49_13790 [Uliginosibacterium sp. H3]|uniref:Uncharacterized protein n=1 Tax=Uliginosibacterium silvisoli TaxID=3114758 RepID=A0ABU6K582_9RHOO|nr:hypothetical protein [Uliginosibacterium sp. H3]